MQWVAVASAGPYASLHLAPDRQSHQHPNTQFSTGWMPFLPPNQQCQSTEGILPPLLQLLLLLYPFNGLFSGTTWVSRYQKGKTSIDLNKARGDGVLGWQWHQLDHMQTICTSLQTGNNTNTSPLSFLTGRMPFLPPNQQRQSTEGNYCRN